MFMYTFFHEIICASKKHIFDSVYFKDTLLPTNFQLKKDPTEPDC